MDRNVFSHKEHIGHKEESAFAEATEDKTGNGERLAPGIGAVEDAVAAPSVWNDIGQLALGNVKV